MASTRGSLHPLAGTTSSSTSCSIGSASPLCILQRPLLQQPSGQTLPQEPRPSRNQCFHCISLNQPSPSSVRPRGPIFATHPTCITEFVQQAEQMPVIDLTFVRLMTIGHARDLHVPDAGKIGFQFHREIALDDLRMIKVHLHLEIRFAHRIADRMRFGLSADQIPRHISRIDRLYDQRQTVARQRPGRQSADCRDTPCGSAPVRFPAGSRPAIACSVGVPSVSA